jgi:exopolysaccharide biosynthesis protein
VRKVWLGLTLLVVTILFSVSSSLLTSVTSVVPSVSKSIQYESHSLPQSIVHTLLIPSQSQFYVTPVISPQVNTVEEFAAKEQVVAVLNGGFFDPKNHKTTSYVVLQGKLAADPRENERLMQNPQLTSYIDKILNRTEFRRYQCGQTRRYDIALHQDLPPTGCQLVDALGGGPRLLPRQTSLEEGFVDLATGRDALGSDQPNARTAIGITRDGSVIWVMAQQQPNNARSGMSLPALADWMKTLGVEQAMNLDGGSSASLYYRGQTFNGKVDQALNPVKRPVKSVLLVR